MGLNKPNLNATRTKVALSALLALLVVGTQTVSAATTVLASDDWVGISFWIATAMMLAFTVFFLVERQNVPDKWKTSMTVAALVTGVAWYHYTYMREVAIMADGGSPLVYRYIDWLITVPLQVVEFYLILAAIGVGTFVMFRNLMVASIVMLVAGFFGESGAMDGTTLELSATVWWVIGMLGWGYILYELWSGDVKEASESGSPGVQYAFNAMRMIVTVGWAIYPIGYLMGAGTIDGMGADDMNILYNVADLVNKGAFGMMIWYAAKHDE
ncbi:MAG: bacteriorhodopsin-like [Candidatus Thalassarchaeaceae archaeon]